MPANASSSTKSAPAPTGGGGRGVRILSTGVGMPSRTLTNADLERLMDTSDEWITQRTGIRTRRIVDHDAGECTLTMATDAARMALERGGVRGADLDFVILATMSPEMLCPPTACRIAARLGAGGRGARAGGAMDLFGACTGYVYGLNIAHDLIKGGSYDRIMVLGGDTLSRLMDYSTAGRGTAIIFGDAGAGALLIADPDPRLGIIAQSMHSDGEGWKEIFVPQEARDFPEGVPPDPAKFGRVQMNGATVFKFAVGTFPNLIQETLDKANLRPEDIDMVISHQSNARILQAARDRFGIPEDKFYINIDRYGNTVAASVPLCLHELVMAGRVKPGMKVMFVAFGAGLTWGSSLWQM